MRKRKGSVSDDTIEQVRAILEGATPRSMSEEELQHLHNLRKLTERRRTTVLRFTESLAGTPVKAASVSQGLRLVVDNDK